MKYFNTIICADALDGLRSLSDESVHCCVTSTPYWGLRDYGMQGQIGLEETPKEFIQKLVLVFREVHRVLKDDGTLWVNIGDSYAHNGAAYQSEKSTLIGRKQGTEMGEAKRFVKRGDGLKPKDLVGIPWMLAFALRADGWYLRQDIIWSKPNPMPESVTDRCTKSHEYIFLMSKSSKYYYNQEAIKVEAINPGDDFRRLSKQSWDNKNTPDNFRNGIRPRKSGNIERKPASARGVPSDTQGLSNAGVAGSVPWEGTKANRRSVWSIPTRPFAGAHFATFPEALPNLCIRAGCPIDGIVLDPFMGAGTTALVARKLNRNYIGIEINPNYVKIAENRLKTELGMFV